MKIRFHMSEIFCPTEIWSGKATGNNNDNIQATYSFFASKHSSALSERFSEYKVLSTIKYSQLQNAKGRSFNCNFQKALLIQTF